MFEEINIQRISESAGKSEITDKVASEVPITVILNGTELVTLLGSPLKLKELAVGYLFAEGFIDGLDDLRSVLVSETTTTVRVETTRSAGSYWEDKKRVITSGCGRGQTFYNYADFKNSAPVTSNLKIGFQTILLRMREFHSLSEVFMQTGGAHSAALSLPEKIVVFCEDIGRHNAVDKVVGEALLGGLQFADLFLLLSGRVSSEMLIKAARMKIAIVVSRAAPTDLAVRLAQKLGISLVGFARGLRLNVYSGFDRII